MKLLLPYLLSIFLSYTMLYSENLSESQEAEPSTTKKAMFLEFYTDWCKFCKVLDSQILPHPSIQETLKNFQTIRINGDVDKSLLQKYKVRGYPTLILLDADGSKLGKIEGLPSVDHLNAKLISALAKIQEKSKLFKQMEEEPSSPIPLYNLALLFYQLEEYEKSHELSLKSYQNSIEITTKKKDALFLLGMSLFRLQKFGESISIWTKFLEDYPEEDAGVILYYRGISYLENGDREKSKNDLKECIEITKNQAIRSSAESIYKTNFEE